MRRLALLGLVALLAGGCSTSKPGGKVVSPTPTETVKVTTQQKTVSVPTQFAKGDPEAGKDVFVKGPCAGCHTLKDAGTNGKVGPNLDDAKPDLELIVDRVVHGKGAMPSFEGQLSNKQIADVSAYVYDATH